MHRFRFIALAAIALFGFASVASAADLPVKAPIIQTAPAAVYNWSGWYAGVNVGGAWNTNSSASFGPSNTSTAIFFTDNEFPTSLSPNSSGVIGGGQIGYNWQMSQWLLGIEADIQASGYKGTASVSPTPISGLQFTTSVEQHSNWFGTLRARLGVLATPSWLFYATGGLAYGQTEVSYNTAPTAGACSSLTTCATGSSTSTRAGWAAGAGVEYMFSSHWTARAEYLYIDLGTQSVTTASFTAPGFGFTASAKFQESIARGAINYKF